MFKGLWQLTALAFVNQSLFACAGAPPTVGSGDAAPSDSSAGLQRLDDYILVSCRVPGEIRQIGTRIT
jgi:hypothetical protein